MFYPIMHLISELRSSPFQSSEQAPLRERALAGLRNILQMKRVADVHTWLVMERMIEKLSADHARGSLGVTPGLTLTPPSITPEVPSEPLPKTTSVKDPVIAQPYFGTEFGTGTTAGSLHKAASYEYTDTAFSVNTFASTIAFEAQDSSYFPDEFTWVSLSDDCLHRRFQLIGSELPGCLFSGLFGQPTHVLLGLKALLDTIGIEPMQLQRKVRNSELLTRSNLMEW